MCHVKTHVHTREDGHVAMEAGVRVTQLPAEDAEDAKQPPEASREAWHRFSFRPGCCTLEDPILVAP